MPNATNAINAANLGGFPGSAFQGKLPFAVVQGDGTILAQSRGINVISVGNDLTAGQYYLTFPTALSAVAVSGAITSADTGVRGTSIAGLCGGAPFENCATGPNTAAEVHVDTRQPNNTIAGQHSCTIVGIP